jgi:chromate transporter
MDSPPLGTRSSPSLLRLFASFLRLGATAFGGPAMVAYIRKMAVEQNQWVDEATFQDGVALCQTIPGATAMQTAAYVGLRSRGLSGAVVCFVGFGLPAFSFMVFLSAAYAHAHDVPAVLAVFQGLRAIIVALVANATISFGKRSLKGMVHFYIAVLAAALFAATLNPIAVILTAAFMGLVLCRGESGQKPRAAGGAPTSTHSQYRVMLLVLLAAAGFALLITSNRGLFDLGALMFRIDLFAFGGGFASIPLMYHEIVDVRSWMDGQTFINGIALGQVTPGPIVITATFVGYLLYGITGAVVATISVFLPSFLMVVGIVPYFDRLRASAYFNRCMSGILASFVGMLLSVTIQFAADVPWDASRIVLAGSTLAALSLGVDVLWIILVGILLSVRIV